MKKILIFARDPGGANCVIPPYKKLKERKDFEVELFGKDMALDKYKQAGLEGKEINGEMGDGIKEFLEENKYDLVLTGTGFDDLTDRTLWKTAKELGIRSVAILDHWLNYKMRFFLNEKIIYPDLICVMDEYAKKEMIDEGIPKEKVVVTGQPYFETILKLYEKINKEEKIKIRKDLGIADEEFVITFASEPLLELFKDSLHYGYNEFTILENIVRALEEQKKKITLVVRLHPKNDKKLFERFVSHANLKIIIENKLIPQELVAISDMVVGMLSMFLIEAAMAGKPYASIQIGLKGKDSFILQKLGLSETVLSYESLVLLFENALKDIFLKHKEFKVVENATDNIINQIEKLL